MRRRNKLEISLLTATVLGLILLGSQFSAFRLAEFWAFDWLKQNTPKEKSDPRIAIVVIDELDIRRLGKWPMSDRDLAQMLKNLKAQKPAAIGLDIYRNISIEPGHQELTEIFANTPNLIGVTRVRDKVTPPPILESNKQIAASDFVLDADSKVRRSLIFIGNREGLGAKLATVFLKTKGIELLPRQEDLNILDLGKVTISPLNGNEGEYNSEDTDGYQILLNYRGEPTDFTTVFLTDVLENRFSPDLIRDRVVLIGVVAPSQKDEISTPYTSNKTGPTPGVVVHANSASQIISAALGERHLLQATNKLLNWLWFSIWAIAGAICGVNFIRNWQLSILFLLIGFSLILFTAYGALQIGWWIPIVTPILCLGSVSISITIWELVHYLRLSYKQLEDYARDLENKVSDRTIELQRANQELSRLSILDGLTQVANRRRFDDCLQREWSQHVREHKPLALILIDIDYFKRYNDRYGHQGGDDCLIRVAKAIEQVPQRSTDLVARYGGEEFVVILPNTNTEDALIIADKIQEAVAQLAIPHAESDVNPYVTLSLGVVSLIPTVETSAEDLISYADRSLYKAKEQGRNRAIAYEL